MTQPQVKPWSIPRLTIEMHAGTEGCAVDRYGLLVRITNTDVLSAGKIRFEISPARTDEPHGIALEWVRHVRDFLFDAGEGWQWCGVASQRSVLRPFQIRKYPLTIRQQPEKPTGAGTGMKFGAGFCIAETQIGESR